MLLDTVLTIFIKRQIVQAIENQQGLKIACLEEIAFIKKWINKKNILNQIKFYGNCDYSNYLKKILKVKNY